jgi:hypothetical protein
LGLQIDTGTVNAVSDSRLVLRAVVEKVSQMTITLAASYLSSHHTVTYIYFLEYIGLFELIVKGRPPAPTVIFIVRSEQRLGADDAAINALCAGLVVLI